MGPGQSSKVMHWRNEIRQFANANPVKVEALQCIHIRNTPSEHAHKVLASIHIWNALSEHNRKVPAARTIVGKPCSAGVTTTKVALIFPGRLLHLGQMILAVGSPSSGTKHKDRCIVAFKAFNGTAVDDPDGGLWDVNEITGCQAAPLPDGSWL